MTRRPRATPVDGAISADGASWTPSGALHTGTKYKVHAMADGRRGPGLGAEHSTFTTLTPTGRNTSSASSTPTDGATYGVGMPVSIHFNKAITQPGRRRQKAITVTAEPGGRRQGHWFGNQRLDFRPENYWEAGTKVTLNCDLDGVRAPGRLRPAAKDGHLHHRPHRRSSVADNKAQDADVNRDGKVVKTIPITSGDAEHTTYNGQMVIEREVSRSTRHERRDGRSTAASTTSRTCRTPCA